MIKEVANLAQFASNTQWNTRFMTSSTYFGTQCRESEFSILAKNIAHQSYLITKAETIVLFTQSEKKDVFDTAANLAIIPFKADINDFIKHTPLVTVQTQVRRDHPLKSRRQCTQLLSRFHLQFRPVPVPIIEPRKAAGRYCGDWL
ncbi:hypothetical protein OH492_16460 [Vibrio chagasii]|nr:hypothetical protein [Vibrio chagasii]